MIKLAKILSEIKNLSNISFIAKFLEDDGETKYYEVSVPELKIETSGSIDIDHPDEMLLDFAGEEPEYIDLQDKFKKFLDLKNIPYEESGEFITISKSAVKIIN